MTALRRTKCIHASHTQTARPALDRAGIVLSANTRGQASACSCGRARAFLIAACLLLALAACAALGQLVAPATAHAATKAEVIAKCETLGLPDHLVRIGKNVAKAVSFDEATGDLIMADIARGEALLAGRSIHDLDADESVQLIDLCASSLSRVGISVSYAFNPSGGADITLYAADGSVIAKFNTMYDEVKRTGGDTGPFVPLAIICLAACGAYAVFASARKKGSLAHKA